MQTSNIALKPMALLLNTYKQLMQRLPQIALFEIIENLYAYKNLS